MSDLTKFIIKAFIRKALAYIGGVLTAHGIMSADEGSSLVNHIEPVLGVVMLSGSAAWTWFYQRYVKAKVIAAKKASPETNSATLERLTKVELERL